MYKENNTQTRVCAHFQQIVKTCWVALKIACEGFPDIRLFLSMYSTWCESEGVFPGVGGCFTSTTIHWLTQTFFIVIGLLDFRSANKTIMTPCGNLTNDEANYGIMVWNRNKTKVIIRCSQGFQFSGRPSRRCNVTSKTWIDRGQLSCKKGLIVVYSYNVIILSLWFH